MSTDFHSRAANTESAAISSTRSASPSERRKSLKTTPLIDFVGLGRMIYDKGRTSSFSGYSTTLCKAVVGVTSQRPGGGGLFSAFAVNEALSRDQPNLPIVCRALGAIFPRVGDRPACSFPFHLAKQQSVNGGWIVDLYRTDRRELPISVDYSFFDHSTTFWVAWTFPCESRAGSVGWVHRIIRRVSPGAFLSV